MDLALVVLLLWSLFFLPLGLVLHWLVLGDGARQRALPLAPVTGLAIAVLVLATLARLGIDAGTRWLAPVLLALSVACIILIWRRDIAWRSRELIGAGSLLLLTVLLVQIPVIGEDGDGPLGYGTDSNPVVEVAAIDAAAGGPASQLAIAEEAAATADERPIGFEQLAAFTVALGLDSDPGADSGEQGWSAYGMHATITGLLAALVALPLFGFARARGVRWFGLVILVPLGVLAPSMFIALANGEGAAIASVPFTTAAVFSLLVTRRDRGWWALVVLFGAAVAATAGPVALLPLSVIGLAWMLLRSDTYEHLSQHDAPVASSRAFAVTVFAAGLGCAAIVPLLRGGELLAWTALHTELGAALRSWPFSWLDTDLSVTGPTGTLENAIWLIGPALLIVAGIYAVARNERRELGVLIGAVVAGLLAAGVGLLDATSGIELFEFVALTVSPLLAALAIRAVALSRENAEDVRSQRFGRLAGVGPLVLVTVFVVLSFAATTVTGTRMVHAPAVTIGAAAKGKQTALVAAGDPWLAFVVDGERVRGGYADADAVSETRNGRSERGVRVEGYDSVVFSSSPLSSDPSLRYLEQPALDEYQVRLFRDRLGNPGLVRDVTVDASRLAQRVQSETADRPGAEREDAADAVTAEVAKTYVHTVARVHTPVEGVDKNTPADRPAGLLLPATDVIGCLESRDILGGTCEPKEPTLGEGCTQADVTAVRSPLDRDRASQKPVRRVGTGRVQVVTAAPDLLLPKRPTLIGVQCFDVPLERDASVLLVHLRDVGHVLAPERAETTGSRGDWEISRDRDRVGGFDGVSGGTRRTSSELGATLTFGADRLVGGHDLVLEGVFGAGVAVGTRLSQELPEGNADGIDEVPITPLDTLRGSANGFSKIVRAAQLSGVATVTNTAGTDVEIGRLFARPRDLPRSCDMPIALAPRQQREVRVESRQSEAGVAAERPGLTLAIVGIRGTGAERTARVALGTYLSRQGLVRYTLVDWTEQYEEPLQVEGCDGIVYTENGAGAVSDDQSVNPSVLADALGDRADAIRDRQAADQ